jgi:hypothetical protein
MKIILPDDGYYFDGGCHYYRIINHKILHVFNNKTSPLINIIYSIDNDKIGKLYKINDETFNRVFEEIIINLDILSCIRKITIQEILE